MKNYFLQEIYVCHVLMSSWTILSVTGKSSRLEQKRDLHRSPAGFELGQEVEQTRLHLENTQNIEFNHSESQRVKK